jgi:hypothetical protein
MGINSKELSLAGTIVRRLSDAELQRASGGSHVSLPLGAHPSGPDYSLKQQVQFAGGGPGNPPPPPVDGMR